MGFPSFFVFLNYVCIAEGFGKQTRFPNEIRRGGFAHSRRTGGFEATAAGTDLFIHLLLLAKILILAKGAGWRPK